MFCMKCGTKLPDEAVFCFNCGQKVGGIDLVTETTESVVIGNSAEVVNETQKSDELLAYLKDVWTISKKIIEVDYAIKNQELKYKICNTASKRRNRVCANMGAIYGISDYALSEKERNKEPLDKGMEQILMYKAADACFFPWEIDIFEEVFQCFKPYSTLEKIDGAKLYEHNSIRLQMLIGDEFNEVPLEELFNAIGGYIYTYKCSPKTKAMAEPMMKTLTKVYEEHPQWFVGNDTRAEIVGYNVAKISYYIKKSLRSRRWSALRATLKKNQLDKMINAFRNGSGKSLPYYKCITEDPFATERELIDALYEDITGVAYPNTIAEIIFKIVGNEKYDQVLDNIESQLTVLKDLRVQLVELLDKIYAKGNIHPKYQHNYIASAMFYEYVDTKRCSALEGANGVYNLFENELRMNTIIDKLDVVIEKLDSIDKTMKEISDTLYSMEELLCSINANTGMTAYNTRMLAMRQDIVNVTVSVSTRY